MVTDKSFTVTTCTKTFSRFLWKTCRIIMVLVWRLVIVVFIVLRIGIKLLIKFENYVYKTLQENRFP